MSDSLLHQIALTLAAQVGPVTAKSLVSYCGSAQAVFHAKRRELLRIPGIGPAVVQALQAPEPLRAAEQELVYIQRHHITALFYTDEHYPVRLKQNADSPALLFFKGSSVQLLNADRIIGLVGTRQPSDYGRAVCEEFIEALGAYGILMVSGLAYGIDITAHRKAVAVGMPNIGVLGHGLGRIYPPDHKPTALKMLECGGLLSEYPHFTKPDREHFPMRNRIITGLCDALLVVETAATGGSMISAELAHQYGRELLAVPGRTKDPKSAGCNRLIKLQRAHLVETAEDVAGVMRWEKAGAPRAVQRQLFVDLEEDEIRLLNIVRRIPKIAIDQLTTESGVPPGALASVLLALEFKGVIRQLPGKRYVPADAASE